MQSSHFPFIKRRDLETGLSRPQCSTSPLCSRRPPQPSDCASGQGPDADADAQSGWSPSLCQPQFQNCGGDATAVISPPPLPRHTHPAPALPVAWLHALEKLGAWAMLRGWVPWRTRAAAQGFAALCLSAAIRFRPMPPRRKCCMSHHLWAHALH